MSIFHSWNHGYAPRIIDYISSNTWEKSRNQKSVGFFVNEWLDITKITGYCARTTDLFFFYTDLICLKNLAVFGKVSSE